MLLLSAADLGADQQPDFNSLEFEGIKNEAIRNSFFLFAKKWIDLTGASGLTASAGGTAELTPKEGYQAVSRSLGEVNNCRVIEI